MSEVRNARRGLIGGVVSLGEGWPGWVPGAATPARALSRCCAAAGCEKKEATQTRPASSAVAGECGNRTHPTLRSRVTVILKITEATRPHPPPRASLNFDRNFSPLDDLADND